MKKATEIFASFLTQKIHFESPFFAFWEKAVKLGKASWDAYYQVGRLILQELQKNWSAKGVASEINDSNNYASL